jgi:hypothetical protein
MVDAIGEARIGTTKVYLQTRTECANGECNFGNLVCDAFVDYVSESLMSIKGQSNKLLINFTVRRFG